MSVQAYDILNDKTISTKKGVDFSALPHQSSPGDDSSFSIMFKKVDKSIQNNVGNAVNQSAQVSYNHND